MVIKKSIRKIILIIVFILNSSYSFSQNIHSGIYIYKKEKLSELQMQNINEAGLQIPRNKNVINVYQKDGEKYLLLKSKVLYEEIDKTDGFYFNDLTFIAVAIIDNNNTIAYHISSGKAISSDGVVDLVKKIKVIYDYSSMKNGTESVSYSYLNNDKLNNQLLIKDLERKLNLYFIKNSLFDSFDNSKIENLNQDNAEIEQTKIPATFSGGFNAYKSFLLTNINQEIALNNNAPIGKYEAEVSFVVDKDGSITDISIVKNPGYGTAEELERVLKLSPIWTPASINGKSVKYFHKLKLTFSVGEVN
jgi:hypothetical protein